MGCIYNGVCSSLVPLFLWQQVTNRYGSLSKCDTLGGLCNLREIQYVFLIWSYIGQEVRKCNSVSTSFRGQCARSLSSLESQVCLWPPFTIARLCSLSLYIVKAFLNFGSVTVFRSSSTA